MVDDHLADELNVPPVGSIQLHVSLPVQPITSIARRSLAEISINSLGAAVGSMIPRPRLSFQWLACWASPCIRPVEKVAPARLVCPPSMEKNLLRVSAVQSMVPAPPAATLSA